eukprot:scaffold24102_cov48-Prasinocladus_malaysianus.AAC.2
MLKAPVLMYPRSRHQAFECRLWHLYITWLVSRSMLKDCTDCVMLALVDGCIALSCMRVV